MAGRIQSGGSWFTVVLVIAAVAIWANEQRTAAEKHGKIPVTRIETLPNPPTSPSSAAGRKTGRYETYENCTLVGARNNDGDSFQLRLPDGRTEETALTTTGATMHTSK